MKLIKRTTAIILAALLGVLCVPVMTYQVNAAEKIAEEVSFNTGNHLFSVVDNDSLEQKGDVAFEKDGSYTINIPENNPFFPYEVQFTCDGVTTNKWFMTPKDSVEVGGHKFYVSAYFDNTTITQASLNVAGKEVVVYPEEKQFKNDEAGGVSLLSLLPLEERRLNVDLTGFTPLELTMVSPGTIFQGEQLVNASKIALSYDNDEFSISNSDEELNLSNQNRYYYSSTIHMIVGDGNQLNADNVRYIINARYTNSEDWLLPQVYTQDNEGNRKKLSTIEQKTEYYVYSNSNECRQNIYVNESEMGNERQAYVSLSVNQDLFPDTSYASIRVFEGRHDTVEDAVASKEITGQIFNQDMTKKNAGYLINRYSNQWITMVAYSEDGKVMGCLPFYIYLSTSYNRISKSLFANTADGKHYGIYDRSRYSYDNNTKFGCYTYELYKEYSANDLYYLELWYYQNEETNNEAVTAAYIGKYDTIAAAISDRATDIKDKLFSESGYGADYSNGVYFSIFIGDDGSKNREVYHYCIKTETGDISKNINLLNSDTSVKFNGIVDSLNNEVPAYFVEYNEDSYGEYNYRTILVGKDVDITNLAPKFYTSEGVNLYAVGSSTPEKSGENFHDFSKGYVQYTASAENGIDSKNYWLSVVKATDGEGKIFINSLDDDNSETKIQNNIIYSKREVMLDSLHDNRHDILLANIGTQEINNISVKLESEVLVLDDYWTLSGKFDLSGLETTEKTTVYGELSNLAKIRLKIKDGIENGTDAVGTLTIKSGDTDLMVLSLTGIIGDPCITTKEIPQAVKYVPYGTMIQNSNKYSWNKPTFSLVSGKLPEGMEVKANGEIYGVPKECGKFTFTVRMDNSHSFASSTMTYTLDVAENTNLNVDKATDAGYDLTQRISNISASGNYLMISQGVISEFKYVYLDGEKLTEGEDYTAESGSTRITIKGQTLTEVGPGTHTLGVEFRTGETDTLKRAAQNYTVEDSDEEEDNNSTSGSDASSENASDLSVAITSDSTELYTIKNIKGNYQLLNENYNRLEAYDISLKNLSAQFPITVVMEAPTGFDMSRTIIIHMTEQNEVDEIFYNGDGYVYDAATNKVSFTVTHFSPFLFVELVEQQEMSTASPKETSTDAAIENQVTVESVPETGDTSKISLWLLLVIITVVISSTILVYSNKKI